MGTELDLARPRRDSRRCLMVVLLESAARQWLEYLVCQICVAMTGTVYLTLAVTVQNTALLVPVRQELSSPVYRS